MRQGTILPYPRGSGFLSAAAVPSRVQASLAPVALQEEPGLAVKVMSGSCACSGSQQVRAVSVGRRAPLPSGFILRAKALCSSQRNLFLSGCIICREGDLSVLVNVGSAWVCRQARGAGLTGGTALFLGLPLVRGLCPTCGDDQPRANVLLWVNLFFFLLRVAPPLTRSSDAEPAKLLFQVTGGAKSPASSLAANGVNGRLSVRAAFDFGCLRSCF